MLDRPSPAVDGLKRAERIAASIEAAILAGQFPLGERLGNEADLARQNGVSRWTMREAIAILEQAGSIVARRGGGGGLFVAAPPSELARNAIGTYFEFAHVPIAAINATRLALAGVAIDLAIQRLDAGQRADLAAMLLRSEAGGVAAVSAVAEARKLLREVSGNTALILFLAALSDIVLYSSWASALDDTTFVALIDRLTATNRQLVLAVLANRREAAIAAEAASLETVSELHAASSVSGNFRSVPNAAERAYALYPGSRPTKKAEAVAWAIRQRIADESLAPGDHLGSESSLMARHGAGRPVLREAVRILERLGVAAMQRGGASGLVVTSPDPARIIALARAYLARAGTSPAEREAVRRALDSRPPNPASKLLRAIAGDD